MALTEIILMFDTITVEDIINFMKDSLTVTKSSSSQVFILSTKCLVFGNMVFATNSF